MGPGGELIRKGSVVCKHHSICVRYGLSCSIYQQNDRFLHLRLLIIGISDSPVSANEIRKGFSYIFSAGGFIDDYYNAKNGLVLLPVAPRF